MWYTITSADQSPLMASRRLMAHSQHSSTFDARNMSLRLRPNMPGAISTKLNSGASPVSKWHLNSQGGPSSLPDDLMDCQKSRKIQAGARGRQPSHQPLPIVQYLAFNMVCFLDQRQCTPNRGACSARIAAHLDRFSESAGTMSAGAGGLLLNQ